MCYLRVRTNTCNMYLERPYCVLLVPVFKKKNKKNKKIVTHSYLMFPGRTLCSLYNFLPSSYLIS